MDTPARASRPTRPRTRRADQPPACARIRPPRARNALLLLALLGAIACTPSTTVSEPAAGGTASTPAPGGAAAGAARPGTPREPGSAATKPPPTAYPESNRRMAARLAELGRTSPVLNYRNGLAARFIEDQLRQQPHPPTRFQLAQELIRAGETQRGVTEAEALLSQFGEVLRSRFPDRHEEVKRWLAIGYLRLGEQQNCIQNHSIDSCLLPIEGNGRHTLTEGSRKAVGILTGLLGEHPDNLTYRWLLNIAAMTLGEYPDKVPEKWLVPPRVFVSDYPLPRFPDVARAAGVDHVGLSGGAAMDDFDGDGHLDLIASAWGFEDQIRFFRNDGRGRFVDRTEEAWLTGQLGGLNLTHADYDNDGDMDLLILRGAWLDKYGKFPNSLLRNLGDGRFEDVTLAAGLTSELPSHSAAWADFDNDGWLDLFVGNESREEPYPCELYRNNGDGTFSEVAGRYGVAHVGFVKGAVWGDYNNDGRPDLYLSRMFQPNVLYRNDGDRFTDVTAEAGVGEPVRSFPTWFFDFDNDGWLDLLVSSFADFEGNALESVVKDLLEMPSDAGRGRLYRNRGDGTFEDITKRAGFYHAMLAMGANFGDLDNDGFLDCYFGTGEPALSTLVPNVMLRNDAGRRFQNVTTAGGFGNIQKGHGIAFGDIDDDGDQDIYAVMGGAYSGDVYQNILFQNPGSDNAWITLRLRGVESNRGGVGARVHARVETADGGRLDVYQVGGNTGSFGSSSRQIEMGLGKARRVELLEIHWPTSGKTDRYSDVPLRRAYVATEGGDHLEEVELHAVRLGGDGAQAPAHQH